MPGPGKGNRRSEWREWPLRETVEVRNDLREGRVGFVLECGHIIEMGYRTIGWGPGVTDLRGREHGLRHACGSCHHGQPAGARSPYTGRCAFFDQFVRERQVELPEIG
jgi:hypothetical protein